MSIKRLQDFLMYEEVEESVANREHRENGKASRKSEIYEKPVTGSRRDGAGGDGSVVLDQCYAKWLDSDREDTLKGINFKVNPGQLVAIVGQVGSGKSSLLNVILKELPVHSGSVEVRNCYIFLLLPREESFVFVEFFFFFF